MTSRLRIERQPSGMQQTEFTIIRHGETLWNRQGRMQGNQDSELTPLGLRQADAVARRIAKDVPDVLYSSDLKRAWRTAQIIGEKTNLQVNPDPRFREWNLGMLEGLTSQEMMDRHPEAATFRKDTNYIVPGGESRQQVYDRASQAIQDLADCHAGKHIAIVTHGAVLGCLFCFAVGIALGSARRVKLYNASVNTVFCEPSGWSLATWGDVSHLHHLESEAEL